MPPLPLVPFPITLSLLFHGERRFLPFGLDTLFGGGGSPSGKLEVVTAKHVWAGDRHAQRGALVLATYSCNPGIPDSCVDR